MNIFGLTFRLVPVLPGQPKNISGDRWA